MRIILSLLFCLSLLFSSAQNPLDTTIDGVHYNRVILSNPDPKIGFPILLANEKSFDGGKAVFHGKVVSFYTKDQLEMTGTYTRGAKDGYFVFYYRGNKKSHEGTYIATEEKVTVREAGGDLVYNDWREVMSNDWKYYDMHGNQINAYEHSVINNKDVMKRLISKYELDPNAYDSTKTAEIAYFKKIFKENHPNDVFWLENRFDGTKGYDSLTNHFKFVFDGPFEFQMPYLPLKFSMNDSTFFQWKSEFIPDGLPFYVFSDSLKDLRVEQCFRTFALITDDQINYVELRNFKFFQSLWTPLVPIDGVYRFDLIREKYTQPNAKYPYPKNVTKTELKTAVQNCCAEKWPELPEKVSTPYGYGVSYVPGEYVLKISGTYKTSEKKYEKEIVIGIPMEK